MRSFARGLHAGSGNVVGHETDPTPDVERIKRRALPALAGAVSAPALVLWGDLDSSGWESGPPLAAALHGRQEVLPGVGHMPMLEAPYAFTTVVRRFLATVHA